MQALNDARYNSIADFLNSLNEIANKANETGRYGCINTDWANRETDGMGAGCATGKDVQRLVKEGWPEGRKRANKMRDALSHINLVPQDRRRKRVRSDRGDSLDIHSVYRGQLDTAWTTTRRRFVNAPQQVAIAINVGGSGSMSPNVWFWRGAAAVVLSDVLEAAGYRVRITIVHPGKTCGGKEEISCRITLKNYDAPLDTTSAACTMLPGFTRALIYGWTYGHATKRIGIGLACSWNYSIKLDPGEIELPQKVEDQATATKWLQDTLKQIEGNQLAA